MSADEQCGVPRSRAARRTTRTSAQVTALRYEVAGLRLALETRAPVEQAKGMLMMRYGCTEREAYDMLSDWSTERHVKLGTVALTLVGIFTEDDASVDQAVGPEALLHHVLSGLGRPTGPAPEVRTVP